MGGGARKRPVPDEDVGEPARRSPDAVATKEPLPEARQQQGELLALREELRARQEELAARAEEVARLARQLEAASLEGERLRAQLAEARRGARSAPPPSHASGTAEWIARFEQYLA